MTNQSTSGVVPEAGGVPVAWVSRVMEQREECAAEGVGAWLACSGCQESEDGYVSSLDYPYSAVFGCQPGGGCSWCGAVHLSSVTRRCRACGLRRMFRDTMTVSVRNLAGEKATGVRVVWPDGSYDWYDVIEGPGS